MDAIPPQKAQKMPQIGSIDVTGNIFINKFKVKMTSNILGTSSNRTF